MSSPPAYPAVLPEPNDVPTSGSVVEVFVNNDGSKILRPDESAKDYMATTSRRVVNDTESDQPRPCINRIVLDDSSTFDQIQSFVDAIYLVDQQTTLWYDDVVTSAGKRVISMDCEGQDLNRRVLVYRYHL